MRLALTGTRSAAVAAALTLGLAGCGSGGGDTDGAGGSADPGPGTTTATPSGGATATSFRTLANAVCRAEVGTVPPVPEPGSPQVAAETRRYVAAVERAAGGLADAFVLLERRRPESQETLAPLVTRARTVVRAARAAAGGARGSAVSDGVDDEIRIAIALLNEKSSAVGLPTCAL